MNKVDNDSNVLCKDLISRQKAQRLFGIALTYKERIGKLTWTTAELKQYIADFVEDLPSAQPDIIRCKDCSRWCICHHSDDWYCADAERRTDESDEIFE